MEARYLKSKNVIIFLVVVLLLSVIAFFGGIEYQKRQQTQLSSASSLNGKEFSLSSNQNRGSKGGAVVGQILSVDNNTLVVKLPDGSSKIVILADNSTFSKTITGSKTDLTQGVNVAVFGTPNPDGSVTAQSVQLNPTFRLGPGPSESSR